MNSSPAPGGFGGSGTGGGGEWAPDEGSLTMFGVGIPIPWWVIVPVILAVVGFQLHQRAQRG
jgi:hypothetical protein